MGSGGPAGTADHVERAAARRKFLGAERARGREMTCIGWYLREGNEGGGMKGVSLERLAHLTLVTTMSWC